MSIIYLTHEIYKKDKHNLSIMIISNKSEWDAETKGQEPFYDQFSRFLSELIIGFAGKRKIYASFNERKSTLLFTKKLKQHQLKFDKFGFFNPGIAVQINTAFDVLELIKLRDKTLEWIFFHIGNLDKPALIYDYQPVYLSKEENQYDWGVFENAEFVIYHECDILYAEIVTSHYSNEDILPIIEKVFEIGKTNWPQLILQIEK